jgi:prepilin-type processing-associated H-X9-DG protein
MDANHTRLPAAPPVQFGLRAMFGLVAAISLWLAAGVWFGPIGMAFSALTMLLLAFFLSRPTDAEKALFLLLAGLASWVPLGTASKGTIARSDCRNNLRQIGFALQQYHDVYGSFPPAYVADANGKPMHSWRVLQLPYLENRMLYQQYDFNEPWDGPNNRRLAKYCITCFRCPHSTSPFAETNYVVVIGSRTLWPGAAGGSFEDVPGGTQQTVLVVETADSGIVWSEPRDLDASTMNVTINSARGKGVSSLHLGGAHVVMADGSVRLLPDSMSWEALHALLTRNGGETPAKP